MKEASQTRGRLRANERPEVQPRVRAKQAYALAVEFAARTGNVVDPGVVAIIP